MTDADQEFFRQMQQVEDRLGFADLNAKYDETVEDLNAFKQRLNDWIGESPVPGSYEQVETAIDELLDTKQIEAPDF